MNEGNREKLPSFTFTYLHSASFTTDINTLSAFNMKVSNETRLKNRKHTCVASE